jgi:hypothetical protein
VKRCRLLFLACAWSIASCSTPENDALIGLQTPDRKTFPLVADALQPSCGTLDCHGQRGRNLRLYGGRGMRLDPQNNSADEPTTDAEYQASFDSLTVLEPEALDAVVTSGGIDPERLSLIRKARGTETHKGGTQMRPGDALDRCVTLWLSGAIDMDACLRVALAQRPYLEEP